MSLNFNNKALINWFFFEKRDLPWRREVTPYKVWISEVMLQQTQVAVVIPYFEKWMERFPDIEALAKAPVEDVIKLWEGLGYYSRARNIHAAAKDLVTYNEGELPEGEGELAKIKGIGPYTQSAIQSFAFHKKAAPVDGNVIRVLSRYFKIEEDIQKPATVKKIGEMAFQILPEEEYWVHSEALIELGAKICQKNPKCLQCPLRGDCLGYKEGVADLLPLKSKKIIYEKLERAVLLLRFENKICIKKWDKNSIMSDLYEFPYLEKTSKDKIEEELRKNGFLASYKGVLQEVSHSFTKYRVKLYPFIFEMQVPKYHADFQWVEMEHLEKLPFSSGHRRVLYQLLESK